MLIVGFAAQPIREAELRFLCGAVTRSPPKAKPISGPSDVVNGFTGIVWNLLIGKVPPTSVADITANSQRLAVFHAFLPHSLYLIRDSENE